MELANFEFRVCITAFRALNKAYLMMRITSFSYLECVYWVPFNELRAAPPVMQQLASAKIQFQNNC